MTLQTKMTLILTTEMMQLNMFQNMIRKKGLTNLTLSGHAEGSGNPQEMS